MSPRTVQRVALGLTSVLALALQVRFVLGQSRISRPPKEDQVEGWLAAVAQLPPLPETATVGFVTTVEPDQWEARLFLTRYALAPRAVLRGIGGPWIVGHFRSPAEAESAARASGLSILGGSGSVFLLGRPAR